MGTPEWCQWRRSNDFIGNLEHIRVTGFVFPLLILSKKILAAGAARGSL